MDVRWSEDGRGLEYVCGSHSGYRHLKGSVIHRRWICWIDQRFWVICDQIAGRGWHKVESLIHFHPDATVKALPRNSGRARVGVVERGGVTLKILPWGAQSLVTYYGQTDEIQGWYTPEMGLRLQSPVWGLSRSNELPIWLGYVLWPSSTRVSSEFSVIDERSCRVKVESADTSYRIVFDRDGTKVEAG